MGTSFWQGVLFELLPEVSREEIERALTDLVRREWIVEHASSKYHGELELAFRHGAILDAAEAGISAPSRAAAHGVVANWLERCGETDASVVAMHLHLAWRLGAAADHFARAAQRALEAGDFAVAAEHAAKGLACSPAAEVSGRLDVVAAQAHRWIGDNAAALLHSRRAMAALTPQGSAPSERWFEAAGEAISGASRLRKLDVMAEVSEALERTTKGLEPTPAQVVAIARAATLLAHAHIDVRAAPLFAYLDRVEPTVSADPLLRARIALARAWRSQTDGDWAG